jgi:predicted metal-dependent peptidase
MNTLTPKHKLAAAILRVTDADMGCAPYFGAILRGLLRRVMPPDMCAAMVALGMTPTLAVTKDGKLFWSEAFVDKCPTDDLAFILMHETMHVVLKHHERAEALGVIPEPTPEAASRAMMANMAMDATVNEQLVKMQKAPAEAILPEHLEQPPGLVFEERYRLLLEKVKEQRESDGDGEGQGGGGKRQNKRGQKPEVGKGGQPGAGQGWCGGCAGHPLPGEERPGPDGKEGRTEAGMERYRKETAEAIKQHTKTRGTVPDSLQRWADEQLAPPQIDWRIHLAQAVRSAVAYKSGAADFDWTRPSRRQAGIGFGPGRPIVPAYRSPQPRIAVIVDTSGSMGAAELTAAASELQGILSTVGAQVAVCTVDAKVHELKEVSTIQDAVKLLKGGGGTDMTPGFEALGKRSPPPDVVVVLTDGALGDGYPHEEPRWCKTVWAVIGAPDHVPCPYGEVVWINDLGRRAA